MLSSQTILEEICEHSKTRTFWIPSEPADPCMLFKKNELGVCIIIMYVDDMLVLLERRSKYKTSPPKYKRNFQ